MNFLRNFSSAARVEGESAFHLAGRARMTHQDLLGIEMNSLVVIPARLASSRLPEKLLLSETGKPVIQYTHEAASTASLPKGIVVATDSQRIVDTVERFGGVARLTDPNAASGTDRVAEVAQAYPGRR